MSMRDVVIFGTGLGIGGAVGYFVARKVLDKKYNDEFDEVVKIELTRLRAQYSTIKEEYSEAINKLTPEQQNEKGYFKGPSPDDLRNLEKKDKPIQQKKESVNYSDIYHNQQSFHDTVTEMIDKGIIEVEKEYDEDGNETGEVVYLDTETNKKVIPETIETVDGGTVTFLHPEESMYELVDADTMVPPGYDSDCLIYYMRNDILTDDKECMYNDVIDIVGEEAYKLISSNPGFVYAVNHKMEMLFEIESIDEEYDPAIFQRSTPNLREGEPIIEASIDDPNTMIVSHIDEEEPEVYRKGTKYVKKYRKNKQK